MPHSRLSGDSRRREKPLRKKIARKAGVRHLVLTHVIPPVPISYLNAAYLGDAGKLYDGPITVGTDGLLFVMPADSDVIRIRDLL